MKRWILGTLCGLILLGLIGTALFAAQNYRDRHLERAAVQADKAMVATLQKQFPVGMTMADVDAGLRARELDATDYNGEILLRQGTQP